MRTISLEKLFQDFRSLRRANIKYGWGSKASPDTIPDDIKKLDCSGFVDYIISRRGFNVPEGSVAERDWFQSQGCRKVLFTNVLKYTCADPNRLFVAGWNRGGKSRHIFLVHECLTLESASRLSGIGSQNASKYKSLVQWCYEIPVVK